MNRKTRNICCIIFALMFLVGLFMINTTTGKLGLIGFIGYSLSATAIFAELCTIITGMILKTEIEKDEE